MASFLVLPEGKGLCKGGRSQFVPYPDLLRPAQQGEPELAAHRPSDGERNPQHGPRLQQTGLHQFAGIDRIEERTAKKVVTTGCGQGSVFGELMAGIDRLRLPDTRMTQAQLYALVNAIRLQESTYKSAGSVHGCALFRQDELLTFVEDVGRHNAIDTIAGWMWLHDVGGADKIFYTTGRLTSEMVIKSAQMGVPIVVSRSGITQMGYELALRLGLALFGRATNRHFICYCGFDRFDAEPEPARG